MAALFSVSLLYTSLAYAESQVPLGLSIQDLLSPEEQALTEKARSRSYPGGMDEEPIQMQQAVKPTATEDEADTNEPVPATEETD